MCPYITQGRSGGLGGCHAGDIDIGTACRFFFGYGSEYGTVADRDSRRALGILQRKLGSVGVLRLRFQRVNLQTIAKKKLRDPMKEQSQQTDTSSLQKRQASEAACLICYLATCKLRSNKLVFFAREREPVSIQSGREESHDIRRKIIHLAWRGH